MLTNSDKQFLKIAYDQAESGFDSGGCPIGSVLARGGQEVSRGHNQRVQQGDPIAHGEMDALRKAGRQKTYRDTVLYTTLSPCMMCSGTIVQFGIPRVVIGERAWSIRPYQLTSRRSTSCGVWNARFTWVHAETHVVDCLASKTGVRTNWR